MGLLDTLNNIFNGKKNANLLIVGLDNSGKTSIVKHMRPADSKMTTIAPTVGFTVEKFTARGMNFTTFDMSGMRLNFKRTMILSIKRLNYN